MSRTNRKQCRSAQNNRKRSKKRHRRAGRRSGKANKAIFLSMFIILVLLGGSSFWFKDKLDVTRDKDFKPVSVAKPEPEPEVDGNKKDNVKEKPKKIYDFKVSKFYQYDRERDNKRYDNILVMGIDGEKQNQSISAKGSRTDVMILVSIDKQTKETNVISIPRDTYVSIPGSPTDKINSAHAVGGANAAARAVAELLDTEVDYYIKINYNGFRRFIDEIGGVTVYIDKDMIYDDEGQNLKIRFKKDTYEDLDGQKAEEYIRWRKNNADVPDEGDGSDAGRIKKMQYFLGQVIKKLKNPGMLTRLPGAVDAITDNIRHSFGSDKIISMISDAGIMMDNMSMKTMPSLERRMYAPKLEAMQDYMVADPDRIMDILGLFHGEGYLNKRYLKIKIENCSGESGIAANFSRFLKLKGYNNFTLTDGNIIEDSLVKINVSDEYMKKVFEDEVNMDNIQFVRDPDEYYDVVVKLGKDHEKIQGI